MGFAVINNPLMIVVSVEGAINKKDAQDTPLFRKDREAPMEAPKKIQH